MCVPFESFSGQVFLIGGCVTRHITAVIEREDDGFVALGSELDIASQGSSIEDARANLIEALTLFFETASALEVSRRYQSEVFVTQVEVPVGSRESRNSLSIIRQSGLARSLFETV